jgi:hypothetical protein
VYTPYIPPTRQQDIIRWDGAGIGRKRRRDRGRHFQYSILSKLFLLRYLFRALDLHAVNTGCFFVLVVSVVLPVQGIKQGSDRESDCIRELRTQYKWASFMGHVIGVGRHICRQIGRQHEQICRQIGGAKDDLQHLLRL